jgi:hypothetical protein
MSLNARSATWSNFSRLASASILAWTVAFTWLHQNAHALPTRALQTEESCPTQEGRGTDQSGKELTASPSANRRLNHRSNSGLTRAHEIGAPHPQIASPSGRFPTKVGHRLANGLSSPLLL